MRTYHASFACDQPHAPEERSARCRRIAIIAFAVAVGLPAAAKAQRTQQGGYVTPGLSAGFGYDSNLFGAVTGAAVGDSYLSVTPALQAGYHSPRLDLDSFYSFNIQRYAHYHELNSNVAQQNAAVDLSYRSTQRLTLGLNGNYGRTNNPSELSAAAGLQFGRATARAWSLAPRMNYRFSPLVTGGVSYGFSRETLQGGIESDTRTGAVSLARRMSERDTGSLNLNASDFSFNGNGVLGGSGDSHSYALDAGWVHDFTPQTTLSLQAGPRVTEGSHGADVALSLQQRGASHQWTLAYDRSLTTVLGVAGAVDSRTARFSWTYWPSESVSLQVTPAWVSDRDLGPGITIYELQLRAAWALSRSVSLAGWYQANEQHGVLNGTADEHINRQVVFVGLVMNWGPTPSTSPQLGLNAFSGVVPAARPRLPNKPSAEE